MQQYEERPGRSAQKGVLTAEDLSDVQTSVYLAKTLGALLGAGQILQQAMQG